MAPSRSPKVISVHPKEEGHLPPWNRAGLATAAHGTGEPSRSATAADSDSESDEDNAESGFMRGLRAQRAKKQDWASQNQQDMVLFEPDKYLKGTHGSAVYWVCFSHSGRLMATCGHDRSACIWRLSSKNKEFSRLVGHTGPVTQCCFSPDDTYLVCAAGDSLRIWFVENALLRHTILAHQSADVLGVDWSPDGKLLASCANDGRVRVWSVRRALDLGKTSGQDAMLNDLSHMKARHTLEVYRAVFSKDGKALLTCSKDTLIKLWNCNKHFEHVREFAGHTLPVLGVAWNVDGSRFASCSHDKTVMVWRPEVADAVFVLEGHTSIVYTVAFCPVSNGRKGRLVSCGHDQQLIFWDYKRGRSRKVLPSGSQGWTTCVTFHPDGLQLATSSTDRETSVLIWARYAPILDVYRNLMRLWNAVWSD